MSCSATAMSSSSNFCSGFSTVFPARWLPPLGVVAGVLTTRAMSASPFHVSRGCLDGASELPGFCFEARHPLRIPTPFRFGKLADYPTVHTLHAFHPDSVRELDRKLVVHRWRRRRPSPSDQVLLPWRVKNIFGDGAIPVEISINRATSIAESPPSGIRSPMPCRARSPRV